METMTREERRKAVRIDSLNLLKVSVDKNDIAVNQGMGRTLNISESGILLETYFEIDLDSSLSLTVAIGDDLISINGKVLHCTAGNDGMFKTGVQFFGIDQSACQVIRKLVQLFREQKNETAKVSASIITWVYTP